MSESNDPCGCNAVLVQTTEADLTNRNIQLAILKSINRESFRDLKNKAGAGADIPIISDIIGGFSADYEAFDSARTAEFEKESYELDLSEAESILRKYVPDAALEEWGKCKEDCSANQNGFHCWVKESDSETVTVVFYWNPPAGVGDAKVVDSKLIGAREAADTVFPTGFIFKQEEKVTKIFRREPNKPFELVVNLAPAYTCSVKIPIFKEDKIILPPVELATVSGVDSATYSLQSSPEVRNLHLKAVAHAYSGGTGQVEAKLFVDGTLIATGGETGTQNIEASVSCDYSIAAGADITIRADAPNHNANSINVELKVWLKRSL